MPYSKIERKYKYSVMPEYGIQLANQGVDLAQNFGIYQFEIQQPSQGTNHNERIGNKISKVNYYFNIQCRPSPLLTTLTNPPNPVTTPVISTYNKDLSIKFRFFIVKFDSVMDDATLWNWWTNTFWNYTDNYPTISQKNIKMTTPYTGSFSILLDRQFTVTDSAWNVDFNVEIGNYAYGENSDVPTNQNIYCFFIMPRVNSYDMDSVTNRFLYYSATGRTTVGYIRSICKMTYLDM